MDAPVQLFRLTDEHWSRIEPLVPPMKWKPGSRGKRPAPDRDCMDAIFYILRTGMQWKALPREYGAASTVHDRFQYWREKGLFEVLWMEALGEFDVRVGIEWDWQSMDGAIVKAPLGGEKNGAQPHRPRQERHEAFTDHGRAWRARGRSHRGRQHA
jgi:transposase